MIRTLGTPLGAVVIALALLSGCTATPITLPLSDASSPWDNEKGGLDSCIGRDINRPPWGAPEMGLADASTSAMDGLADGRCHECPLTDAMLDGGAGDAEAGTPVDAGLPADALVGDIAPQE